MSKVIQNLKKKHISYYTHKKYWIQNIIVIWIDISHSIDYDLIFSYKSLRLKTVAKKNIYNERGIKLHPLK